MWGFVSAQNHHVGVCLGTKSQCWNFIRRKTTLVFLGIPKIQNFVFHGMTFVGSPLPGQAMPPKGTKRASNGGGGNAKAKAKAGALQNIPADAQKMAHMTLLDKWMILGFVNYIIYIYTWLYMLYILDKSNRKIHYKSSPGRTLWSRRSFAWIPISTRCCLVRQCFSRDVQRLGSIFGRLTPLLSTSGLIRTSLKIHQCWHLSFETPTIKILCCVLYQDLCFDRWHWEDWSHPCAALPASAPGWLWAARHSWSCQGTQRQLHAVENTKQSTVLRKCKETFANWWHWMVSTRMPTSVELRSCVSHSLTRAGSLRSLWMWVLRMI